MAAVEMASRKTQKNPSFFMVWNLSLWDVPSLTGDQLSGFYTLNSVKFLKKYPGGLTKRSKAGTTA